MLWNSGIPDDDDDDDDDRDGLRNVGSIETPDAADSPRRFHRIYSPRKLRNKCYEIFTVDKYYKNK
jgi:hypothetical protein